MLDRLPLPAGRLTREGALLEAAPRLEVLFGFDLRHTPRRPIAGRLALESHRDWALGLRQAWEGVAVCINVQTRKGRHLRAHLRRDGDAILGLFQDITEERTWHLSVEQSERSYRALIDEAPNAVVVHREHKVLYANSAAFRHIGEEPIGWDPRHWVHPDDTRAAAACWTRVLKTRRAETNRRRFRIHGTTLIAEVTDQPVVWHQEWAVASTIRDITQQMDLDAARIQRDRLASLGTLAAGLAHEINNPLTYVLSNLEFLALDPQGPDRIEALNAATEGAERIAGLVRDVRGFVQVKPRDQAVDLDRVVQGAVRLTESQVRRLGFLTLDLQQVPPFRGDSQHLHQVVVNLLLNARHAFDDFSPAHQIGVSARALDERVELVVRDNGRGMDPIVLDRVFEPFFTTRRDLADPGTGLGLSMTRTLVEAMGGTIKVQSSPGEGACFTVSLPLKPATRTIDDTGDLPAAPSQLLLVDDEPNVLRSLSRVAERKGHTVLMASTIAEAIQVLKEHPVDLILSDLIMPDGGGPVLLAWVHEHRPDLVGRFAIMTGADLLPELSEGLTGVDWVHKPIGYSCIEELLQRSVG